MKYKVPMKLKKLNPSSYEIGLNDGTYILVSYETPVAMFCGFKSKFFRTDEFWSNTTSKHINQWLPKDGAAKIPQRDLDALFKSI